MKKLLFLFLFFPLLLQAGTTNVTATITGADSVVWANGSFSVSFRPTPGKPLDQFNVNGNTFPQGPFTGTMDSFGTFTITLTDNITISPSGSEWAFTICPNATAQCYTANAVVTGASQNLSTTLSATAPALKIFAQPIPRAYNNTQVTIPVGTGGTYWDVTFNQPFFWNGVAWVSSLVAGNVSTSGIPVSPQQGVWTDSTHIKGQDKPVIDLQDWVDCTGAVDTSVIINSHTGIGGDWCGKKIVFGNNCIIRVEHPLFVQGCTESPEFDLGAPGNLQGGGHIAGCIKDVVPPTGLPAIPVMVFSRTAKPYIHGGWSEAQSNDFCSGASNATQNIAFENDSTTYPGGVTGTQFTSYNHGYFAKKNGAVVNWVGIGIGRSTISNQNLEGVVIENNSFNGQFSNGSVGIFIKGHNSDHGRIIHNHFLAINTAIKQEIAPYWTIASNVYGSIAGALDYTIPNCVIQTNSAHLTFIQEEPSEATGQYMCPVTASQGPSFVQFIGGALGGEDIGQLGIGLSNINCGQCIGSFMFRGVRGKNLLGNPIIGYDTNNGNGAFIDAPISQNRWLSSPVTIDVTKGASYDSIERMNSRDHVLQTILGASPGSSPLTPALTFQNIDPNNKIATSEYNIRSGIARLDGGVYHDSLVIANTLSAGNSSLTLGPKIAGGLVTQAGFVGLIASVTPIGTGGVATWGYKLVGYTSGGLTQTTAEVTTAVGNATLTSSNYNRIIARSKPEYWQYCLWRTTSGGTPATLGLVSCVIVANRTLENLPTVNGINNSDTDIYFADTGTAGDGATAPATTANGSINIPTGATFQINSVPLASLYNHTGTLQTASHYVQDTCTLGTDCGVTLTNSAVFTSSTSYTCTCQDNTAAAACKVVQASGSAFTITGTGTDVIRYSCMGN